MTTQKERKDSWRKMMENSKGGEKNFLPNETVNRTRNPTSMSNNVYLRAIPRDNPEQQ